MRAPTSKPTKTRSKTPPKTKWGDKEARREDILRAARRLLERRGYSAFNVRDVARDAGVTAGTVYTYFTNKEELFAILYAERLDRLHDAIAPLAAEAKAEELFVAIADRYLEMYRVFGRELDVWAMARGEEAPRGAEPLVAAAARIMALVAAALHRLKLAPARRGGIRLALPLLWATVTGLCDQFTGKRHVLHASSWDEMTRFAARTLIRGLE
jgi:AcrR family transcriptional regulator